MSDRDDWNYQTTHGRSTGRFMDYVYRVTEPLDWINKVEGRITAFFRALKRRRKKTSGALGIVRDVIESAAGANTRVIYFSREGRSGLEVERMLRGYGIHVGGRRVTNELTCGLEVSEQQAAFAEYLICRYTGGVKGGMVDPRNARAAAAPGMPRRWADADK